jgi:hypothetical protein
MDLKNSNMFVLLLPPLAVLLAGPAAAQHVGPDLVITEDTQLTLEGKRSKRGVKAVVGSCEYGQPLWEGKIALKNIGDAAVKLPPRTSVLGGEAEKEELPPHVRVYVPNYIYLTAQARLTHTLEPYGQELLRLQIGREEEKCRDYGPPPIFDEALSGHPGPLQPNEGGPYGGYGWQIKKIQSALIDQGYPMASGPDGDYGPETSRAVAAYFKNLGQSPPREIYQRPLPPETVTFLLETLAPSGESDDATETRSNECVRGYNYVPVYIEIDPERAVENENAANNRVQFTVEIDCGGVAK